MRDDINRTYEYILVHILFKTLNDNSWCNEILRNAFKF